ncbi:MAG: glucoamylase family protein [Clostridia bacterium]
MTKNTLKSYLWNFKTNFVVAVLFVGLTWWFKGDTNYWNVILSGMIAALWCLAPFTMFYLGKPLQTNQKRLNEKEKEEIKEVALHTWNYFDSFITEENNYLIPDNYQLSNGKIDYRTSPTNIGFSLTSVVSAYELGIIKSDSAVDLIKNIIINVKSLKKWNGHLYNWYDIYNKHEIYPFNISTADSGNFIASLYVIKSFLEKNNYKDLADDVNKLISETNFLKLYNEEEDVFSIGYNVVEDKSTLFNYNTFSSETRLASFIAIAKGDVPFKHWFCLDKTLTKHKRYKGIISWTGTMFEYYMPLIFMRTFKHTILDETYSFVHYVQKEFMKEVNHNLPWGITESAYSDTDDLGNYKYKAFGIPYLKTHDIEKPSIVVAPYASIMAITKFTQDVYTNLNKFKKLNMYGEYGFYESYDNEEKTVVKSYYPHHQGMIISSIANYFKNNVIQDYFHSDKNIESVEILLKEKVQIRPYIDLRIEKYKKYRHEKEEQDNIVRVQDNIEKVPTVGILSNGKYTVFLNDRGLGFSKYKNIQINRYRVVSENSYGIFVYLKDITNDITWTNTYMPSNKKPDNYRVIYSSGSVKYIREDNNIVTSTEIAVTKDYDAEIRRITIENNSENEIELEATSYGEIILGMNDADLSNRVFNDMTLSSEIDSDTSSLIFLRSSRKKTHPEYFVATRMFVDKDDSSSFEFETSRMNFIGRNNTLQNPTQVYDNKKLSCNTKESLDPIMSIRKNINLKPKEKKTIYLIVSFADTRKKIMDTIDAYKDSKTIDIAFKTASLLSDIRNNYLNLSKNQFGLYNSLLKYIYQPYSTHENVDVKSNISKLNIKKLGLSTNIPLILVNMEKSLNLSFIKELFKLQEFYKSMSISINIVILYSGDSNQKKEVENFIIEMAKTYSFETTPGNISIFYKLNNSHKGLLRTFAKVYFDISDFKSLNEKIVELNNRESEDLKYNYKSNIKLLDCKKDNNIDFYNEYGGFINNGKEYLAIPDTPVPWVNVIANPDFGFVITNNMGGFTYAYNSREFKLTSWSNDVVRDNSSETIYINNQKLVPNNVVHGFGYSVFNSKSEDFDIETKVFVAQSDNIKIYELDITKKNNKNMDIDFVIKPVLGAFEEQTNTHIISEFIESKNCLILQNVLNKPFKNEKVFISSTENIFKYDNDNILDRTISINLKKSKKIAFIIGCSKNIDDILKKYKTISSIDSEYKRVVSNWDEKLSKIQVNTPDKSFDYMINGWYLYQVYASRLYSRTGFYQVGGAYGFRDQLQDVMGLLYINPEYAKERILDHATHQFVKGDVLHWWHEELKLGARTRFSDDYLWLIYVTYEYVKITGDASILDEKVYYVQGDNLGSNEKGKVIIYSTSKKKDSLYEHLKVAIKKSLEQMGRHGLPLIGTGDWNDGLNKVGEEGKGESVWLAVFLYELLTKMELLATTKKDTKTKDICIKASKKLKDNIQKKTWDGSWYLRAYFDDGKPLGSKNNKECKIDLLPQAWSILTDIIPKDKIKDLIKEVDERLVDKEIKIIKLLSPPFDNLENNPGYISDYIPGVRENGAQYTHAALWYIKALLKANDIDKANEYYSMINPVNRTQNKTSVDIYKVEPYVICADIYSNKNFAGRGGWTWYTGSSSWAYKIAIEDIIGLQKEGNKLYINPKINSNWNLFEIKYTYENTVYNIYVKNPDRVSTGIKNIIHNDKIQDSNVIELVNDKKKHDIIVNMGGKDDKI